MEFDSKDPASQAFWDQRFQQRFTPWDQGGVPQEFQQFAARFSAQRNCLIPGCGNAYEAAWLLQQGWQVDAIDFSAAAVASAQAKLGEWGACVQQADFFVFQPAWVPGLIYERAFLCALPPAMRAVIVRRWAELLPAQGLLAGYFLIDDDPAASRKGPPFCIGSTELNFLLNPHFEQIENCLASDPIPVFSGKEYWQVWQKR